ncbi:hypothetical protein B0H12DRAFT_604756 [Mycena haematopus]|nr:hypothetical protein B0H12DRAFT_604756 [Mycena haematopus]
MKKARWGEDKKRPCHAEGNGTRRRARVRAPTISICANRAFITRVSTSIPLSLGSAFIAHPFPSTAHSPSTTTLCSGACTHSFCSGCLLHATSRVPAVVFVPRLAPTHAPALARRSRVDAANTRQGPGCSVGGNAGGAWDRCGWWSAQFVVLWNAGDVE